MGADAPASIVVAPLFSPDMAAFFRGIDQGTFKNAGLDIRVETVSNGGSSIAATISGSGQHRVRQFLHPRDGL